MDQTSEGDLQTKLSGCPMLLLQFQDTMGSDTVKA